MTLLLSPKLNYEIGGILVNDVAYPVRSDGVYTFTVNDPCTVRGLFVGVEKEFVLAKKNIGNVDISGNTEDGRFLYGDHLVVSVMPSEGILFKGWSSEGYLKDGGVLIDTAEAYDFVLTEDTTIYANFEDVNTYSASYVSDFLTGEIKPFASLSADEYGELPLYYDVKRRDGYVLTGFNTERDASGDSYSVGSMFVMPHRDVVFYPEWTKCTDPEDLLWQSNGNTVEVLGIKEGAIDKNGVLCLPDEINGMNVTAIRADALSGNLDLMTVILPPGVVSIGDRCFSGCSSLKAVYLPETLAALGRNAFAYCDAFTDLRLLQSYAKIYDLDYDSALAEKYMRLKTTEGKRVILVGGSNLCFGINSRMIREAFPQYDVVNFSTSHLYGLSPLLDLVERNVHEGDVIVLAPEYYPEMFCARETSSFNNWEYVDCNPDMLKDIDVSRNQAFLNTMLTFFYNKRVHSPRKIFNSNPVYARSGFNEYGDLETKRTANKILEPSIPPASLITDAGIGRINGAFRSYTEKGAKCFFTFTSMSLGTNSKSGVVGAAGPFLLKLREGLDADAVTIISEFGDYLFDASQCYGNCYHLSMEAAVLRT
ncbi:MAG: leucine-rich repeat protein, partial [Lachnospiraceae bacterium]|nr:leucine-rich repeat protein [Lachnospiraceae bacterium]